MNSLIALGTTGIPLTILEKSSYPSWLAAQNPFSQNWLQQSSYTGKGLALLPNFSTGEEGSLSHAIFVVDDASHYFACGDLINKLPAGQYQLNAATEHLQAICFAWLIGAYTYQPYKTSSQDKILPTLVVNEQTLIDNAVKYAEATALVRDLVNTPAVDMMPKNLGDASQALAKTFGGKVSQIIADELLDHNYPTIHAVGRASVNQPRLIDQFIIVFRYI